MKQIALTQGKFALVDDEDFDRLSEMRWHAWLNINGNSFYAHHSVYNKGASPSVIRMHRFLLDVKESKIFVDHINGNTLDNRKENLRLATNSQNIMNAIKMKSNNSTGYRGVSKYFYKGSKKWTAGVTKDGVRYRLGYFDNPEDAARAYDKKAKELHGEFCGILNFE